MSQSLRLIVRVVKVLLGYSFGGDQLTVARERKGRTVRTNARDLTNALHGLVPLAADWHTKVNFMSVSSQLTIHFH